MYYSEEVSVKAAQSFAVRLFGSTDFLHDERAQRLSVFLPYRHHFVILSQNAGWRAKPAAIGNINLPHLNHNSVHTVKGTQPSPLLSSHSLRTTWVDATEEFPYVVS